MGAWGTGHFENDSALDFQAEIEETSDPKKLFNETLDIALESDFLEGDEGSAVIVTAVYIDSQINGTASSEVDSFNAEHLDIDLSGLREKAVEALKRVLSENSELNGLWEENEGEYSTWRKGVEQLIERLAK